MWRFLVASTLVVAACSDDGIGKLAPETVIDSNPTALTNQTHAVFAFHAEGDATGFQCTVDGTAHGVQLAVLDRSGRRRAPLRGRRRGRTTLDGTPATATGRSTRRRPTRRSRRAPPALDNSVAPSRSRSPAPMPSGRAVTFECALDGAAFAACTSPATRSRPPTATTRSQVRAIDAAGNADPTPATLRRGRRHDDARHRDHRRPGGRRDERPSVDASRSPRRPPARRSSARSTARAFAACTSPLASPARRRRAQRSRSARRTSTASSIRRRRCAPGRSTRRRPVTIDRTRPNPTNDNTPTSASPSPDATATFECAIDAAAFAACTLAVHRRGARRRLAHVRTSARPTRSATQSSATFTWVTDTVAPTVTITSGPSGGIATNAATFAFTTAGRRSRPSARSTAARSPRARRRRRSPGLADGAPHASPCARTDAAGNTGSDTRGFTVDTTPPDGRRSPAGRRTRRTSTTPTFSVHGRAVRPRSQCRSTPARSPRARSPVTTAALADGSHTFAVRGTDAVGNTGDARAHVHRRHRARRPSTITARPDRTRRNSDDPELRVHRQRRPDATAVPASMAARSRACTSPITTAGARRRRAHVRGPRDRRRRQHRRRDARVHGRRHDRAGRHDHQRRRANPTNTGDRDVRVHASARRATTQCQLDGGAFAACTLAADRHRPRRRQPHVRRRGDRRGRQHRHGASFTWTVDTIAPTVTHHRRPDRPDQRRPRRFTFTVSGSRRPRSSAARRGRVRRVHVAVHDRRRSPTAAHTFAVRATDARRQHRQRDTRVHVTVDTTAPTVTITSDAREPEQQRRRELRVHGQRDRHDPAVRARRGRVRRVHLAEGARRARRRQPHVHRPRDRRRRQHRRGRELHVDRRHDRPDRDDHRDAGEPPRPAARPRRSRSPSARPARPRSASSTRARSPACASPKTVTGARRRRAHVRRPRDRRRRQHRRRARASPGPSTPPRRP